MQSFTKLFLIILLVFNLVGCKEKVAQSNSELVVANKNQNTKLTSLQQWQNMKFGMFIHWGVYSIPAGVWEGEKIEKLGEQIMRHADISIEDYEAIAKQFNPTKFDAEAIVKLARDAGMKYIILTAKHHDGFSMFKSNVSNYNVVDFTPYKKDILQALAKACKKYNLKLGVYYSTPDWHFNGAEQERNPDDNKLSVFGKVSKENEKFQVAQLKEILTNYGEIVELFFDMGEPTTAQSKLFKETVKNLQPNCLINGRVMNNQGDFITMPDNHLPDVPITGYAWETPGTFYHTWGYKSWVKGIPLAEQIDAQIKKLSKITCLGGNFLLNIGPKSDGTVLTYETAVLKGVGNWVAVNKEAIFDTQPNPFKRLNWGYSSVKPSQNKLYLHVFDWPKSGKLVVPGLRNNISKAYFLNDKTKDISVISSGKDKTLLVGKIPSDPNLSIIVVEYKKNLSIIDPIILPNKRGNIILADHTAIKHGKYGMKSYRSIIKDYYRTWDVLVEEEGVYDVEIIYKMKYDTKDFIIASNDDELAFTLTGKAPVKLEPDELFDGNEQATTDNKSMNIKYGKKHLGTFHLKKGIQTITFKSGKDFEFKASLKDFKAQNRKYRGLNVDTRMIKLIKTAQD